DSSYDVLEGVKGVFVVAAEVGQQGGDVAAMLLESLILTEISSRDLVECKSLEIHSYEGNEKDNETLIALTPILSVKDKWYEALQVTDTVCRLFLVGASFIQRTIPSIPIGGSISPEGFLLPIPLLVMIMVMVVIVVVILVDVVVTMQTSAMTTAMTAILKQFQATPPPASVKSVEEIRVTCGGAHRYYQCLAAGDNTFPELRDNIQGYLQQPHLITIRVIPFIVLRLRNEMKYLIQASMSNQTNELKNMMASFFHINTASGAGSLPSNTVANPKGELKAIATRSGIVLDGPSVPIPPPFINPKEDERVKETLTDQDLAKYTIKVPPPLVQKSKPLSQRDFVLYQRDPLHPNIPYPSRMLKQKQQEKNKVQIHKFWQMFKQLHINITLAGALILMPKYQKMLKALISNKEKLQELANTPLNKNCSTVILKKLPEKLGDPGNFSFQSPFILGRPFLWTTHALIDVHGEEMIFYDGDERLTLNMRHDTSSYSNQPQKESINLINVFNNSNEDFLEDLFSTNQPSGNPTFSSHPELTSPEVKDDIFDPEGGNVLLEKLLDLDSTKDLHPPLHVNPLSGSTIYSSSQTYLLEEFADELALITFPPEYDDYLQFDIEIRLIKVILLILTTILLIPCPEMFTDEHALDYSSPPLFDEYDDDLLEVEFDTENIYDNPFDSKGEKIKEFTLLIDELDLPCDFLPPSEYDSFLSKDFSKVDALPSTNNEDNVFNPCILIQENLFEIITRVANDKKLAISNASLMIKDFDPPLYELPFFKEVL
nr:reverse transcriptase domain-containing protein [Tanacetum cinerariifolium]